MSDLSRRAVMTAGLAALATGEAQGQEKVPVSTYGYMFAEQVTFETAENTR